MFKATSIFIMCATSLFAVTFDRMRFDQNIDTNAINAMSGKISSNDGLMILSDGGKVKSNVSVDGIMFEVNEDQTIKFNIVYDETLPSPENPLSKIVVNGKSLLDTINEAVDQRIVNGIAEANAMQTTNTVRSMVYNPLWGKKLAVIGDSLTCTPTIQTSYPYYIAQRNNMTLVHKGRSGERLCTDRTETNPSTISSYTNDIPADADFILVQIGANDQNVSWADVEGWNVSDTDMTTNTFKGCWNLLLIGLKTSYPNAKIGIILANNWRENLGQKTEDVLQNESNGSRRQMTQWQKIQCQKLNIPVLDPVEDTRMFLYHYKQYETNSTVNVDSLDLDWYDRTKRQIGTDHAWYKDTVSAYVFQTQYMRDSQHTTDNGNLLLSFFYEQWMKTVLMAN